MGKWGAGPAGAAEAGLGGASAVAPGRGEAPHLQPRHRVAVTPPGAPPSRWPPNLRSAGGVYELRVGARQAEGGRKGAGAVGDQLGHHSVALAPRASTLALMAAKLLDGTAP